MVSRILLMSVWVIAPVRTMAMRKMERNAIAPTTRAIKLLKASFVMRA